jgi:hypothetical protein
MLHAATLVTTTLAEAALLWHARLLLVHLLGHLLLLLVVH